GPRLRRALSRTLGAAVAIWLSAGPAVAQPTFTPISGPSCTGTYVYPLPHLSTEPDAGSTRFTSVVIVANFSPATSATLQACACNNGGFLGGTTFTLPTNNRIYATDPPNLGTPPPGTRPLALGALFNLSQLPMGVAIPAVLTSNVPLEIQYGFI